MLSSITPLGERGRAARWPLTTAAYLTASVLAGAALGAALGGLGGLAGLAVAPRAGGLALAGRRHGPVRGRW